MLASQIEQFGVPCVGIDISHDGRFVYTVYVDGTSNDFLVMLAETGAMIDSKRYTFSEINSINTYSSDNYTYASFATWKTADSNSSVGFVLHNYEALIGPIQTGIVR